MCLGNQQFSSDSQFLIFRFIPRFSADFDLFRGIGIFSAEHSTTATRRGAVAVGLVVGRWTTCHEFRGRLVSGVFLSCAYLFRVFPRILIFSADPRKKSPARSPSVFFSKKWKLGTSSFFTKASAPVADVFEARWPIFSCGVFPVVKTVPRFRGKNQDPRGKIPIPRKKYYGARGRRTSPASAVTDICRVHF